MDEQKKLPTPTTRQSCYLLVVVVVDVVVIGYLLYVVTVKT